MVVEEEMKDVAYEAIVFVAVCRVVMCCVLQCCVKCDVMWLCVAACGRLSNCVVLYDTM